MGFANAQMKLQGCEERGSTRLNTVLFSLAVVISCLQYLYFMGELMTGNMVQQVRYLHSMQVWYIVGCSW